MKIGRLLSILLIICIVPPLLAACGGNTAETAAPVSNAKSPPPVPTPALDLEYGLTLTYTTNTELPPLKMGDTQFYDVSPSTLGRFKYRSDYISSESAFEAVLEALISSYGEQYELQYNQNKNTTTASWMSEDSLFMMNLVLDHRYGKPFLELYITRWPNSLAGK